MLDLRSNGGGSLSEAINIAGLFIPPGPVVLVKDQNHVQALEDQNALAAYDGPLIIMVNRFSASASEIVAAALQDYGRAIVVGDSKTHGKGTVQSLTQLSPLKKSLGELKVTTASFHRINGGSTQLIGVVPDIVIPSTLDALEAGEEFLPNALTATPVPAAQYTRDEKTESLVPVLRKNSEARRAADPKFNVLTDLIARVKKQQAAKEITLKFDDRLLLAKSDKALEKQLDENDPSKAKDETKPAPKDSEKPLTEDEKKALAKKEEKVAEAKKKANDIILTESLHILADWINSNETKAATTAKSDADHT